MRGEGKMIRNDEGSLKIHEAWSRREIISEWNSLLGMVEYSTN